MWWPPIRQISDELRDVLSDSSVIAEADFALMQVALWFRSRCQPRGVRPGVVEGVAGLVGNTPLVRITSLSEATGCEASGA